MGTSDSLVSDGDDSEFQGGAFDGVKNSHGPLNHFLPSDLYDLDDEDYYSGYQDVHEENLSRTTLNQLIRKKIDDIEVGLQNLIVESYIEWEHVTSISRRLGLTDEDVVNILNMRGVSFYSDDVLYRPWLDYVDGFVCGSDIEYIAGEAVGPDISDVSLIKSESRLIVHGYGFEYLRGHDFTDCLRPSDKRRLIRFVAGYSGVDAGIDFASRLRDYRMLFFLCLQRRDVLGALEALNAQAMTLSPSFERVRHMLRAYVGDVVFKSLSAAYNDFSILSETPTFTLSDFDKPFLKDGDWLRRAIAAYLPSFKGLPIISNLAIAIGERDWKKIEGIAHIGDKVAKWYCVDRSIRAMKSGDSYRCDLEWAHDVAGWSPNDYGFMQKLAECFCMYSEEFISKIRANLCEQYLAPWG